MGLIAPQTEDIVTPLFIPSQSMYTGCENYSAAASGPSTPTTTTTTANRAIYVPLHLPFPYNVRRMWYVSGSTITSTNVDMGIYTDDGTAIWRMGSTAMGTASTVVYATVSPDILLTPGRYYMAYVNSSTTSRGFGSNPGVPNASYWSLLVQATALPLPATMTPAVPTTSDLQWFGITRTASGF